MRVALVHDYLTQRGGAERVLLSMLKAFPDAPLYTSLYEPDATYPEFADHDVRPMWTNRFAALRAEHRRGLPLYPLAFRHLRFDPEPDVVLCSSSGFAHGVRTDACKVVYCYTPARWLYDKAPTYLAGWPLGLRLACRAASPGLRVWDRRAAQSAVQYLTSAPSVAEDILHAYSRDAIVLPPPVHVDPTGQQQPVRGLDRGFVLCVARLIAYKNVEAVVSSLRLIPGSTLVVVGDGPEHARLAALAPPNVTFVGRASEAELRWLYSNCVGLVSAAYEDFGLTPIEAAAFGKPVAVLRAGGFLDTVDEGKNGVFFDSPEPRAIAKGLVTLVATAWDREAIVAHALNFGEAQFVDQIRAAVAAAYSRCSTTKSDAQRLLTSSTSGAGRRLRVTYIGHTAMLSGGELALARLLPALADVKPRVLLAEGGPLVGRLQRDGVPVEIVPMGSAMRNLRRDRVRPSRLPVAALAGSISAIWRLTCRLRADRPDIVHTNTLKAALYGGLAGRLAGVPVVWHLRDRIADDYLPGPAVRLVRSAGRLLPSAVIGNSQATLSTLGLPDHTRIHRAVVASPVPTVKERPPVAERAFTVGLVGRLAPWKGQDVFLRAFAQTFPGGAARARIVGSAMFGEDDWAQHLADLAAALGVADRVDFIGFAEDVSAEYAVLDVFVHASVIPEPFGQVVFEAMACGLPVVAPDAGGPGEAITDGVDGLLYPMGDIEALAERLRLLAAEPELRISLGEAGRLRVAEFTPDKVAAQVMEVYSTVLRSRRRR